jgi:signal transduction histidine kinase
MKPSSSLRFRLMAGTLFWTVGLLAVTNVVITGLVFHAFPGRIVHLVAMSLAAFGLLVAGLFHIRSILAPFRQLRARLGAVRDGTQQRLEGSLPTEVQPLVDDLNALLDHRSQLVSKAVAKAGDLAHGLKTPLAVLGQEAARLTSAGHYESAAIVGQQVERMRRQIDYHLAQARAAASGNVVGTRSSVLESVEGLSRTLARLYAEKGVDIRVSVQAGLCVRVPREDLDEMLGNLLDNACKWTKSGVSVQTAETASGVEIRIDDDGPGIPAELRTRVLQRGVRADEAAPGSGIGLAIVADLAEAYGGSIVIDGAPSGGVRARLTLPPAG